MYFEAFIGACSLAQAGGEITDFVIVLRTEGAVRAFSGRAHLSLGAGLSVAAGPLGRSFEADIRAGDGGAAACYTYSLSKGAPRNTDTFFKLDSVYFANAF